MNDDFNRRWALVGGVAGIAAVMAYFVAGFGPFPWPFRRVFWFAIGPSGVIFILGLGRLLTIHRKTVAGRIGTVFGVIGMAIFNVMGVVQAAISARMDHPMPTGIDAAVVSWVRNSVNSVHLGMDVSFDIFLLISVTMFGAAMVHHPRFGYKFGVPGAIAAVSTLGLNLYAFPIPPEPDLGPVVALWLLAVAIRLLLSANSEPEARAEPATTQ
jgi:hypothetical protein